MTPDQRVAELCKEHAQNAFISYDEILKNYLRQDGLKAMPQVIREIETYDPTRSVSASQQKFRRYEAAAFILSHFDGFLFRVRAFAEGREAIAALKRMSERLRIALANSKEKDEYEMGRRYRQNLSFVAELEGNSSKDDTLQETLKIRYDINLSDDELSAFVNYLIERDPYYPSWSKMAFLEVSEHEGKGKTTHLLLMKPEPYYQAYLEYKAKKLVTKRLRLPEGIRKFV